MNPEHESSAQSDVDAVRARFEDMCPKEYYDCDTGILHRLIADDLYECNVVDSLSQQLVQANKQNICHAKNILQMQGEIVSLNEAYIAQQKIIEQMLPPNVKVSDCPATEPTNGDKTNG